MSGLRQGWEAFANSPPMAPSKWALRKLLPEGASKFLFGEDEAAESTPDNEVTEVPPAHEDVLEKMMQAPEYRRTAQAQGTPQEISSVLEKMAAPMAAPFHPDRQPELMAPDVQGAKQAADSVIDESSEAMLREERKKKAARALIEAKWGKYTGGASNR